MMTFEGLVVRPYGPEAEAFVLSSWKNAAVGELERVMTRAGAFALANAGLKALLPTLAIRVAVSPGSGEVPDIYHGWIARDAAGVVVARHIKPRYQGMGILELLEAST